MAMSCRLISKVVSGGEVCAQSGALSNPTRDTSCGTRFPAPRSASSRE